MPCDVCDDEEWVCENNPDLPWRKARKGVKGCDCGAGRPRPACNAAIGTTFIARFERGKGIIH
jgi:hypothetical protein